MRYERDELSERNLLTIYVDKGNAGLAEFDIVDALVRNPLWECVHPVQAESDEPLDRILTREIIGTQQTRFIACPNKDSVSAIQAVVESCIEDEMPIPFLVPMGPRKPISGRGIDPAELSALVTLSSLQGRLSERYRPGAVFHLREEDVTGWVLEADVPTIEEDIDRYLSQFETLVQLLGLNDFIMPFRESKLTTLEEFRGLVRQIQPYIGRYIRDSDIIDVDEWSSLPSYFDLEALGWRGLIPVEQREFYRDRFTYLYPDRTQEEIDAMMVQYFASTLARYKLESVYPQELRDTDFLQLNFTPPVPGIPKSLVTRRVYYRTLPRNVSKRHIPFWRARGVLKRERDDQGLRPVLISFNDRRCVETNNITISNNGHSIPFHAEVLD